MHGGVPSTTPGLLNNAASPGPRSRQYDRPTSYRIVTSVVGVAKPLPGEYTSVNMATPSSNPDSAIDPTDYESRSDRDKRGGGRSANPRLVCNEELGESQADN